MTDPFDCEASQLYERLDFVAAIADNDGADEFFDTTDRRVSMNLDVTTDEFFTPMTTGTKEKVFDESQTPVKPRAEPKTDLEESLSNTECDETVCEEPASPNQTIIKEQTATDMTVCVDDLTLSPCRPLETIEEEDSLVNVTVCSKISPSKLEEAEEMDVGVESEATGTISETETHEEVSEDVGTQVNNIKNEENASSSISQNTRSRTLKRKLEDDVERPKKYYRTLAESILHFEIDTPPRFRTRAQNDVAMPPQVKAAKAKLTMAESPLLETKHRAVAHSLRCPRENSDQLDKSCIKALPMNPKVFLPPSSAHKPEPRPSTVPEPFNITQTHKKSKEEPTTEVFIFKAKPVPQSSLSRARSTSSLRSDLNYPLLMKQDNIYEGLKCIANNNKTTKMTPFSFDERDRKARIERDEKIKMLREYKTPKFIARSVPNFIARRRSKSVSPTRSLSHYKSHESLRQPQDEPVPFKAQPAKVLHKEPFIPKKADKRPTTIQPFDLNTEKRAVERERFTQAIRDKENLNEQRKEEYGKIIEEMEKEKLKKLRTALVHKPTPVPPFIRPNN